MLSSPGIGSGLDVRSIVEQLMQLERRPLLELNRREAELQGQVSAYGQLRGALDGLRKAAETLADPALFDRHSATSSVPEVVTASAAADASEGSLSLEVKRIAERHRLASGTAFADSDTTAVAAAGETMTIAVGGAELIVDIGGKTLAQVRDAINDAADNNGITALLFADDTGHRLMLAAQETGAGGFVTVTYGATDPFALASLHGDRDGDGTVTASDLNAELVVEGQFTVTSGSNTVTGVVQGLTFELHDAGTARVTVTRDRKPARTAIESFVAAYNEVVATMAQLRERALSRDRATLLSVEAQLRDALNTRVAGGAFASFAEIGLRTGADGALTIGEDALDAALADPERLAEVLTDETGGLAVIVVALAERLLGDGGLVDGRQDSLTQRIERIDRQRQALEQRLTSVQERLFAQFSALDGLLAELNQTSDFLSRQFELLADTTARRR